ncbi:MAG: monovalent cation/H+ antiporter subunit D family protein [Proteobacteria bacterium]|nr:monovalent cation/H+ antiporter subunit D family protein [Pseudomonadota bacterium]
MKGRVAWGFAMAVMFITFIVSVLLALGLPPYGLTYMLGGWTAPIGIEYRIDALNSYLLPLISGAACVMAPFALRSIEAEIPEHKQSLFYAVFLLMLAGLLGMSATNDIFNIYVFLEIASLATYALIAMGQNRKALTAAYEYLVQGTIGATFFLIGIGFLYFATGTLNISNMATRLPQASHLRIVDAGIAFVLIGLALKIAYFPLQGWLVNGYTHAPSLISAFLAATATKVSVYLLLRLQFTVFSGISDIFSIPLAFLLFAVAILGIVLGSIAALYQSDIKRLLAFSSIANIGYLTLGIALATSLGLTASLTHFYAHALSKAGLFLAVGCVFYAKGSVRIEDMAGLLKSMPFICICFIVCGLSLVGVPGTVGFISKWMLLQALLEAKQWGLLVLVLMSSILSLIYIWKVAETMYFGASSGKIRAVPASMQCSLALVTFLNILFGFYSAPVLGSAARAAYSMFGVYP